jgi:hypothetical protein
MASVEFERLLRGSSSAWEERIVPFHWDTPNNGPCLVHAPSAAVGGRREAAFDRPEDRPVVPTGKALGEET